ncbi:MAG: transcriptional regulator [Alphaproteobacteria bacterium]|nr:MAG: transcriptional regulator [Alphaproteobacteria bacterium]
MTDQTTSAPSPRRPRIVSSAHLVSEQSAELSEFEFGMIMVSNAFNRWVVRCMAAAGVQDVSAVDVLILHTVNHRDREKRLSDIAFVLNIEDSHVVKYSLKKLMRLGLVQQRKLSKEGVYRTTDAGQTLCRRYREVRENCLIAALGDTDVGNDLIGDLASHLRALSGLYDQASRAATTL